jgi:hypothetical protein
METTRPKTGDQDNKKTKSGKKRVSKRDPLEPAFRSARVRKADSRTADTGNPSIP